MSRRSEQLGSKGLQEAPLREFSVSIAENHGHPRSCSPLDPRDSSPALPSPGQAGTLLN